MQRPQNQTNNDQPARLLDLLPQAGSAGFGAAMLRLAQMAAAQHRALAAGQGAAPWTGLKVVELTSMDMAGHGSPVLSRNACVCEPVTREGDR